MNEIFELRPEGLAVVDFDTRQFIRWHTKRDPNKKTEPFQPVPLGPYESAGYGRNRRTIIDWDRFNPNGQ